MITQVSVQNFKSWRDSGPMRLAPITALFGTNSSGKTSIFQLLLMLKQTAESSDRGQVLKTGGERGLVELGTFEAFVYRHDLAAAVKFDLEWDYPRTLDEEFLALPEAIRNKGRNVGFSARVGWKKRRSPGLGRLVVKQFAYHYAGYEFGMRPKNDQMSVYDLITTEPGFPYFSTKGRPQPLPPPQKYYGFPDQIRVDYSHADFLVTLEFLLEEQFSRLFYLGPLRDHPKREYSWAGSEPTDMGPRGERVVDALLAARERGLALSRGRGRPRQTLEQRVAQCLKELGLIHTFEVRPIVPGGQLFQVWVRRHRDAPEVLLTDIGFGVSQILPVITLCYYAPEGSTILLEQPEIHLHPAVQTGLADVLIDAARTRNVQIIVESHSEHLLRRLQRRVAEASLSPDDAALYFCSMENGESRLTTLQLDTYGNIQNWPEDFFGDQFGEISATATAALKRRQRAAG